MELKRMTIEELELHYEQLEDELEEVSKELSLR